MKLNRKDNFQIERIILGGIVLIIIGFLTIILSPFAPLPIASIVSDIGSGLLSAGILTIILERSSRRQHEHDVEELKESHFESILKGLMPEQIFEEVQAHIIREPFLRRNFFEIIELQWADETKNYLLKSDITTYEVENLSKTLEVYELRVSEERLYREIFPNGTIIEEIRIQNSHDTNQVIYNQDNLQNFIKNEEQFIKVFIQIKLKPNQKVKIFVKLHSIFSAKDVYPALVNRPTIGFNLTVAHPKDIVVNANPNHPSSSAFEITSKSDILKNYKIEAGILPFQGIELSWHPVFLENELNDNSSAL